jgi:hypothetical protein
MLIVNPNNLPLAVGSPTANQQRGNRPLRHPQWRWIVERLSSWFHWQRGLVRLDYHEANFASSIRRAMKGKRSSGVVLAVVVPLLVCVCPQSVDAQPNLTDGASGTLPAYLGRWDLTMEMPSRVQPLWIELSEVEGRLEGLMVGLGGHATPTGKIQIKDGGIEFAAPEDVGFPDGTLFKGRLTGGELAGTATLLSGASWRWSGRRAPALTQKRTPRWGAPIRLFDGKDLAGWTFVVPNRGRNWSVEDGTLVMNGRGSDIVTTETFRDFKLHVEFNCAPMANSGVYLRGRYEVQIETDSADAPASERMGAVYGFIAPEPALPRTPDVWQSYDITLVGRTVTLVHDGRTVIDHREIPGITGGALDSSEGSPGPIYLQGIEPGRVAFRNIVITPAQ